MLSFETGEIALHVYFCSDIIRLCRIAQEHEGSICLDMTIPGAIYIPGVKGARFSSVERHVCEYDNGEILAADFNAILINKFSLNIIGGVLAMCGIKPEDPDFWTAAARYIPSHFEDFFQYPPDIDPLNVDRIRAFDINLNAYRSSVMAGNSGDLMPLFHKAHEKLRYILATSDSIVNQMAAERIQEMGREWKSLVSINEKEFIRRGSFEGAGFRSTS